MPTLDTPATSQESVYGSAIHQLPDAVVDFGKEVWAHPVDTAVNLGTNAAMSAAMGFGLAALLPAKGPAGWVIGAAFTLPMIYRGVESLVHAHEEAAKPGANVDQIGRQLADGAVSNGVNLGVTFAGGWAGAHYGYEAGASDTAFGKWSRATRTKITGYENTGLLAAKGLWDSFGSSNVAAAGAREGAPVVPQALIDHAKAVLNGSATKQSFAAHAKASGYHLEPIETADATPFKPLTAGKPLSVVSDMPMTSRLATTVGTRLTHLSQSANDFSGLTEVPALIHGHTALSDGDATPQSFIDLAKAAGYKVVLVSEHDHILARAGVSPTDERAGPEGQVPIVGSNPQEEATARDVAAANSVPGESFYDWGEELGTIGKLPPKLDANGRQIPRGANHTGIYGYPGYLRTSNPPAPGSGGVVDNVVGVARAIGRAIGMKAADAPIAIDDIGDGRFDLVAQNINSLQNPENPVIAVMNHPRMAQDFSPKTPLNQQGHDYGMSMFPDASGKPSFQNWLSQWGDKYGRLIEGMRGGALSEKPIPVITPSMYSTQDAQMMWDKGVHLGLSAGPDIHFQARIGQPALSTTLLTKSIDRAGVYEALDARRTAMTSNFNKVTAQLTANNGQFVMGNILDQSVVGTQGLTPQVRIGGAITPDANYTVNIWSDPKTGDGQLATIVQTKNITGTALANQNNVVTFDPIMHEAGNQSLIYAEVQRTDGASPTFGDVMGTTARNADGTPANVVKNEQGTFVKGLTETQEISTEDGKAETHITTDFGETPVTNPEVLNAINTPPNTPYPERAMTSPIFIDPISGVGTTHSHFIRGVATTAFQTPLPIDQQK